MVGFLAGRGEVASAGDASVKTGVSFESRGGIGLMLGFSILEEV